MKKEALFFTQVMKSLLNSSLPLQDAISVCAEIMPEKKEKFFCKEILKKINEGKLLSETLKEYKRVFSELYISLIKIGEQTGSLESVFTRLCNYLETKKKIKRKITQALAYPMLVLISALVVMLVVIFFALPRLNIIFEAFSETSIEIEKKILAMKSGFFMFSFIFVLVIFLIATAFVLQKTSKKAAYALDSFLLKVPYIERLIKTLQMQDFSFSVKLMTISGFPLVNSLESSAKVVTNRKIKKSILTVCKNIENGMNAGESFEKEKVFPSYFTVWVKIAEKNGNVESSFEQISKYYSEESENITSSIVSYAEPILILITGILIILFIFQIIIPIFNILGAL